MEIAEGKAALRGEMRAIRKNIGEQSRARAAEALVQRLVTLPAVRHARCIGVYHACGSELSLESSITALRQQNPQLAIVYPLVVSDEAMVYARFAPEDDTSILANPAARITNVPHERVVATEELDIALVPGIAFDEQGRRLGQGGGYYDRILPHLKPEAVAIGIAFDEQVIAEVPASTHDRRVDYILTPTRLITT